MSADWITSAVEAEELAREKEKLIKAYRAGGVDYLISQIAALSVITRNLTEKSVTGVEDIKRRMAILEPTVRVMAANQVLPPEAFADEVTLTADMSVDESAGFYKLEYNKSGVPFRWTGPSETSRVTLYLNRDTAKSVVVNICNFSLKNDIEVFPIIDGVRTTWASIDRLEVFTSYRAELPRRETKLPTLVGFQSNTVWRPSDLNPDSQDERLLGLAFHSLVVN